MQTKPLALPTEELRKKVYQLYFDWIEQGCSPDTFTYKDKEYRCCGRTIVRYFERFPDELSLEHKEYAEAKGYAVWEKIVMESAQGINDRANTASLQMVMRNKYGWDKNEKEKPTVNVEGLKALKEVFSAVEQAPLSVLVAKSDEPKDPVLHTEKTSRPVTNFP